MTIAPLPVPGISRQASRNFVVPNHCRSIRRQSPSAPWSCRWLRAGRRQVARVRCVVRDEDILGHSAFHRIRAYLVETGVDGRSGAAWAIRRRSRAGSALPTSAFSTRSSWAISRVSGFMAIPSRQGFGATSSRTPPQRDSEFQRKAHARWISESDRRSGTSPPGCPLQGMRYDRPAAGYDFSGCGRTMREVRAEAEACGKRLPPSFSSRLFGFSFPRRLYWRLAFRTAGHLVPSVA